MMPRPALLLLPLLAALLAGAAAQEGQNAACTPLPPPPAGDLLADADNGVTNPRLLNSLVKAVDESRVFPDSKTIVDMPLKAPSAQVADAFDKLSLPQDPQQRNRTLTDFVNQWLTPPGSDMVNASQELTAQAPPDWFESIPEQDIRQWAYSIYDIWHRLTRQLAPDVYQNTQLYTMLPVPNPFVIPGARFREIYYWDTYWVLKGLLASNLTTLSEGIIGNFVHLMQAYGHIPNGIRTYYLNRSQPPLFSEMVRIVYEATGNQTLLREALPALLREHQYWTSTPKQVAAVDPASGRQFNVSRYYARWQQPRPESYIEDVETARKAGLNVDAPNRDTQRLWRDLASAAESGWDFSTRWFADGMNLTTIRTTRVIPADLNGFLLQMEDNIAAFAGELGCTKVEQQYSQLADSRRDALNTLFWDNSTAQWHDLICTPAGTLEEAQAAVPAAESDAVADGRLTRICRVERNPGVFASNWVPLWAGAVEPGSDEALASVDALETSGLFRVGGVMMSLTDSGQQWDAPNVWPPVDWMLIDGVERYGGEPGDALARSMASHFLSAVYATWAQTGRMFEKFNATSIGLPGGGGEYEVVDGFGWTNGAVLDLLQRFGFQ